MSKSINKVTGPKKLIGLVCQYYGLKNVKQLAASPRLSSWRYKVYEEARQIFCLVLQRHWEGEPEVALKELGLDWGSAHIRLNAEKARRQLAEDYALRLSLANVEQMIVATLIGKSGGVQPYVHFSGWKRADYINKTKEKGKAK